MAEFERENDLIRPGLTLGRFVIVFLLIMVGWVAWFSWMRPTGYCPSTSRYISDDEMFASALGRRAHDIRGLPEKATSGDIGAFIKQNKDCCAIVREGPFPEGMFDRLLASGTWIQVLHELKPKPNHGDYVGYEAFVKVDGCGQVRKYYGLSIRLPDMLEKKLANKSVK